MGKLIVLMVVAAYFVYGLRLVPADLEWVKYIIGPIFVVLLSMALSLIYPIKK